MVLDCVRRDAVTAIGPDGAAAAPFLRLFGTDTPYQGTLAAPSGFTTASVASFFTGRHPYFFQTGYTRDHKIVDFGFERFKGGLTNLPTLAETLQRNGYATCGVVANPVFLASRLGFHKGFEGYVECKKQVEEDLWPIYPKASQVHDRAKAMLAGKPEPFFFYLHYMDGHWPYERAGLAGSEKAMVRDLCRRWFYSESREELERLKPLVWSLYLSRVRDLDREIAGFMEWLDGRGMLDNTLVLITADHGEEFLEHGGVLHNRYGKPSLYSEMILVPWMLKVPEEHPALARKAEASWIRGVDLFPTLLDLVGIDPPPVWLDGNSIFRNAVETTAYANLNHLSSVATPTHQLICNAKTGELFMYAHYSDPLEQENLVGVNDPQRTIDTLLQLSSLSGEKNRIETQLVSELRIPSEQGAESEVSEVLKGLGYLK